MIRVRNVPSLTVVFSDFSGVILYASPFKQSNSRTHEKNPQGILYSPVRFSGQNAGTPTQCSRLRYSIGDSERNALALSKMDDGKALGLDRIPVKALNAGGHCPWKALMERFSNYIKFIAIPNGWGKSKTVLLHKKGDKEDLKNYRPTCLLSHLYKLSTKVITNSLSTALGEQ